MSETHDEEVTPADDDPDKSEGVKEDAPVPAEDHNPAPLGETPAPAELPPAESHLLGILGDVVTALEHMASDRPAGNYLRQLTGSLRTRIAVLEQHFSGES